MQKSYNKVLVATDLHGSLYYGQKIVDKFFEEKADVLVLLGDLYYHGPRNPFPQLYDPMGLATLLNSLGDKLIAIKGNCDSEVDQMVSSFALHPYKSIQVKGRTVFLSHGHRYNVDNIPAMCKGDMLYGHTHINRTYEVDGRKIVNLASVALPKDNEKRGYLVIEEDITFVELD